MRSVLFALLECKDLESPDSPHSPFCPHRLTLLAMGHANNKKSSFSFFDATVPKEYVHIYILVVLLSFKYSYD